MVHSMASFESPKSDSTRPAPRAHSPIVDAEVFEASIQAKRDRLDELAKINLAKAAEESAEWDRKRKASRER